MQLRKLLEMISLLERQLVEVETEIKQYLAKLDARITLYPGVGNVLGAVILSEIGAITRFSEPAKLVAFVWHRLIGEAVRQVCGDA